MKTNCQYCGKESEWTKDDVENAGIMREGDTYFCPFCYTLTFLFKPYEIQAMMERYKGTGDGNRRSVWSRRSCKKVQAILRLMDYKKDLKKILEYKKKK